MDDDVVLLQVDGPARDDPIFSLARVASERLGKKSTIAEKNRSGGSSRSTSANVNPASCRKSVRSFGGLGRTTL